MTTTTMTSMFETAVTATPAPATAGGVAGGPRVLLRIEGAIMMLAGIAAYAHLGAGWGLFALLFLTPDLAFFGYLAGPRVGAAAYNTTHSYLGPAILAAASLALTAPALLPFASIWAAHVGFDRMMGYGLKYASAFGDTHLGRIGRDVTPE